LFAQLITGNVDAPMGISGVRVPTKRWANMYFGGFDKDCRRL
jgi:hypothetical protein